MKSKLFTKIYFSKYNYNENIRCINFTQFYTLKLIQQALINFSTLIFFSDFKILDIQLLLNNFVLFKQLKNFKNS